MFEGTAERFQEGSGRGNGSSCETNKPEWRNGVKERTERGTERESKGSRSEEVRGKNEESVIPGKGRRRWRKTRRSLLVRLRRMT
jgi:hypothetical protein